MPRQEPRRHVACESVHRQQRVDLALVEPQALNRPALAKGVFRGTHGVAALAMAKTGDIDEVGGNRVANGLNALGHSLVVNLGSVTVLVYPMLALIWSASM